MAMRWMASSLAIFTHSWVLETSPRLGWARLGGARDPGTQGISGARVLLQCSPHSSPSAKIAETPILENNCIEAVRLAMASPSHTRGRTVRDPSPGPTGQ